MIKRVTLMGTGVIGRSWIQVFSRAGCETRIYDQDRLQVKKAMAWFKADLEQDVTDGFITAEEAKVQLAQVSEHDNLAEALSGAGYVQESGPERLEIKRAIFTEMDQVAGPLTILASSTSALDIEDIAGSLKGAHRCVTAHPFNPPHILPAVEMMATRKGDPAMFERACAFLRSVGQKPVKMNFFIPGYLANRIQAAVVREAIHLARRGVANIDAIDSVIRDGLGLRWAILGNFGTNNTNADGGIREYYGRYGQAYFGLMNDLDTTPPSFDSDMIEQIGSGVDAMEGSASVSEICRWRDRVIRKIRVLKDQDPHP